jgi:integrase
MKFAHAIDEYVADMRSQGRINSANTETAYRRVLDAHCDDVANRDPGLTGRGDVKRTLRRWEHPNSQRQAHAILVSFYDWAMEEERRDTNPARMVRRARARSTTVFRPTREEVVRLMDATTGRRRERWVVHLGVLAGARRAELAGLQGRHFARAGWVWFSADIAKGHKERWVPVLGELAPVVEEIRALVGHDDYVIPSRRSADPPHHTRLVERPGVPISSSGLYKMVQRVGRRAGWAARSARTRCAMPTATTWPATPACAPPRRSWAMRASARPPTPTPIARRSTSWPSACRDSATAGYPRPRTPPGRIPDLMLDKPRCGHQCCHAASRGVDPR